MAPEYAVNISEIIGNNDPPAVMFDEAKGKEIQGLIERGTWKVVLKDKMSEDANVIEGRFVLL